MTSPTRCGSSPSTTVLLRDQPLLTDFFERREDIALDQGRLYVFRPSGEERSRNQQMWLTQQRTRALELTEVEDARNIIRLADSGDVALRSRAGLQALWTSTGADKLCLDITGVDNDVWAPLLRAALDAGLDVKVLYVEPREYNFAANPRRGELFTLSELREGLDQVPSFAALDLSGDEVDPVFIPLLGFEGARVRHAFNELEPKSERVVPVVGAPGFRVEYPMHTYQGNELFLEQEEHWTNITFAIANCPFSVFYRLQEIALRFPGALLQIGLLGTKPHALGAVLYAIEQERLQVALRRRVGLIHDHPVAVAGTERTTGLAHALLYDVSGFMTARG